MTSRTVPKPPPCADCKGSGRVRELISVTGEPELDRWVTQACRTCDGSGLSVSTVELLTLLGFEDVVKVNTW